MNLIDPTMGMNNQARAVMAYMDNMVPDFAWDTEALDHYDVRFQTRPWYNGRERGFVISMAADWFGDGTVIHIALFEHRNSDQICTLAWETDSFYYNGIPSDEDTFDLAYHGGAKFDVAASFKPGAVGEAADWIYHTLEEFYTKNKGLGRINKPTNPVQKGRRRIEG